jgi:hypothetical protein
MYGGRISVSSIELIILKVLVRPLQSQDGENQIFVPIGLTEPD